MIEDYGSFVNYNQRYAEGKGGGKGSEISYIEVIPRMEKAFPEESQTLLLLNKPLDSPGLYGFTLLFKVDKVFGYGNENFYLYKPIR